MSSWRILAWSVVLTCVGLATTEYGAAAFPMSRPLSFADADMEAGAHSTPQSPSTAAQTNRERDLARVITSGDRQPERYLELARLQQARGAISDAEATLQSLARVQPDSVAPYLALATLYRDTNRSIAAAESLDRAARFNLQDPNFHHMLAVLYGELATTDRAMDSNEKRTLILRATAAEDRALALWPDFPAAVAYREVLRREGEGTLVPSTERMPLFAPQPGATQQLPEAKASPVPGTEVQQSVTMAGNALFEQPLHAGLDVPFPTKRRDVRPSLPARASEAGVDGTVSVEIIVNGKGDVISARVVGSIPLLDQAALDTVRQWSFAPSTIAGKPVSVMMTVPVTFERR